jgi:hypothetical protein
MYFGKNIKNRFHFFGTKGGPLETGYAGGMLAFSDMFLADPSNKTYIDRKLFQNSTNPTTNLTPTTRKCIKKNKKRYFTVHFLKTGYAGGMLVSQTSPHVILHCPHWRRERDANIKGAVHPVQSLGSI